MSRRVAIDRRRDRSRDAATRTRAARSRRPGVAKRSRDARAMRRLTARARDATQVVFAVLGGWAVVIAGARSALS